ncbi:TolC family outer membrane protein [Shimia haliotis]|uniref:Outer membrane protein n=1 Tax=Shimia haliotis TaxID=1280847 RepID=A0A1I4F9F5_9RHOB|nr:TolC family outer membrane protein [Shimia haliotis]SFL14622.1 outer membrane protein [Shimia haliotis]
MLQKLFQAVQVSAVALTVSFGTAQTAASQTLADAMATAYEHSGLLDQNRALLRAADEDVAISMAALRPVVSWISNVQHNYGNGGNSTVSLTSNKSFIDFGVSADLLIFDNGVSKLLTESAKETVLATRQGLVSVEQSVLFNAVQAFMDVVANREIVELRQNNLRLLQRELQAAQDRFEVGEVTRTDVSLAEARLAGARAQLAAAQGDFAASQEFYAAAVGVRPGNLIAPRSLPRSAKSIEDAKEVAIRAHPSMLQVQHQIAAAELAVDQARAAMGPSVTLRTGVSVEREFGNSNFTDGAFVGLRASAPIYQGGRLSALVRKSQAVRDQQRANLHVTRHNIRQNAGTSWSQLSAAGAQIQASVQQVEASRIAFEGVREEAKLGARTTLDVLTAEQDLLDAETDRISAQATQVVAAYALLSSMGQLTVDRLNLKVERYDPEAYYNMVKDAPTIRSEQGQKLDKLLKAIGKE